MTTGGPVAPAWTMGAAARRVRAILSRPPGVVFHALVALAFVWTVAWTSAGPTITPTELVRGLLVWSVLSVAWLVRLVIYFGLGGADPMPARGFSWWAGPAVGCLVLAMMFSGITFGARFMVGEAELRGIAQAAWEGESVSPGWYGTFEVRSVQVESDRVFLRLRGATTFVWSPWGRVIGRPLRMPWGVPAGWSLGRDRYD